MNGRRFLLGLRWLALFAALGFAFLAVAQMVFPPGDIDGDFDVDSDDIALLVTARNTPAAGPTDPQDLDGDGEITVLDARVAATQCTEPECDIAVTCYNLEARDEPVDPVFEPCVDDGSVPGCSIQQGDTADLFFATTTTGGVKTGSEINERSQEVMQVIATALMTYPGPTYTLEGHTSECGTNEENIPLGQARAVAARDYLVSLGISAARFKVISYGEERPFCTQSDVPCWQKNDRVRIVQSGRGR